MRRREFMGLVGGVAVWPFTARAQREAIPVIGYLSSGSPEADAYRLTVLRRGLNEAGYVEGRNVVIEYRWANNQFDRLPALAADLAQNQVAVLVAPGVFSARAAKDVTKTIPIVFSVGFDPVQTGLVESLNRPGGNLTGFNVMGGELGTKGLQLLHELLPATTSIGILVDPRSPTAEAKTAELKEAAGTFGVNVHVLHASSEREIDAAFVTLVQARAGALLVSNEAFFNTHSDQLAALGARYALPVVATTREFALAGGLMGYGFGYADIYRMLGLYVARILKGEKPVDLPVIQTAKIELVINLKTAKALGITIPPTLLARADEVIEEENNGAGGRR